MMLSRSEMALSQLPWFWMIELRRKLFKNIQLLSCLIFFSGFKTAHPGRSWVCTTEIQTRKGWKIFFVGTTFIWRLKCGYRVRSNEFTPSPKWHYPNASLANYSRILFLSIIWLRWLKGLHALRPHFGPDPWSKHESRDRGISMHDFIRPIILSFHFSFNFLSCSALSMKT